ncbi:MAG: transcription elongation factor GreA [Chloroflexota bacterium]|nr:transcription elongation factor GreA [Chloroflexota bacterium]
MRTQQMFLTREGYQKLEQELNYLCTVRRGEVAQLFRQTLPEGDILENWGALEYIYNELSFVEGRIQTIRNILSNAVIIEGTSSHDMVGLGSYVTIVDLQGDGALETYRIVGSTEADPIHGNISNESPLGKELMGRKVGEEAVVDAPDGNLVFKIVGIHSMEVMRDGQEKSDTKGQETNQDQEEDVREEIQEHQAEIHGDSSDLTGVTGPLLVGNCSAVAPSLRLVGVL